MPSSVRITLFSPSLLKNKGREGEEGCISNATDRSAEIHFGSYFDFHLKELPWESIKSNLNRLSALAASPRLRTPPPPPPSSLLPPCLEANKHKSKARQGRQRRAGSEGQHRSPSRGITALPGGSCSIFISAQIDTIWPRLDNTSTSPTSAALFGGADGAMAPGSAPHKPHTSTQGHIFL